MKSLKAKSDTFRPHNRCIPYLRCASLVFDCVVIDSGAEGCVEVLKGIDWLSPVLGSFTFPWAKAGAVAAIASRTENPLIIRRFMVNSCVNLIGITQLN